ncbi:MAG: ABC transporter substrate-binding protein [Oscillospiraceae bacterium]|jgi:ABC-type nitrate/sulfonate/bicarbonate transport system substrate-binding protein|nr:ABC transporter substrate-binding protein [Oscillospiraceae bacterium]
MRILKKVSAALLALTMLAGTAACSKDTEITTTAAPKTEKTKISFVLDWTPNTNHTGLYVAQAKGFFEEADLEVEITQPPEDGAEVLVGSGKAQFGVSFQDSMTPAIAGDNTLPITAVAALVQHNTSGIISRKGEGMDSPKGLEGKKYATWDLPVEKAMIKDVVEKDGGDFSKVQLIPSTVTDEVSALESKSVDAIWVFYGWGGIATEVAQLPTEYFAFKDINPVFDYYTPVLIANNSFLSENPEAAKAFLAAAAKGYEFAATNPGEAAQILMDAVPELKDSADLVTESQKYLSAQYKAEESRWGYIDPARWNGFYNWLNENGLAPAEIPENTGFSNSYLPVQ